MSAELPENVPADPYHDPFEPEEIRIGGLAAWMAVVAFLFVCVAPPVWRNVTQWRLAVAQADQSAGDEEPAWVPVVEFWKDQTDGRFTLPGQLREFNSDLEDAPFTDPPRRAIQEFLTANLHQGNAKTVLGRDGWLFFGPAVGALTGAGPVSAPALGPASDPKLKNWEPALPVIRRYAAELRQRGIELVLIPVPVKPMILPDDLGGGTFDGAVTHRDAAKFRGELEAVGVIVLDFTDALRARRGSGKGAVFLRQDTHWHPRAMEWVAREVAEQVKSRPWFSESRGGAREYNFKETDRGSMGDLVEKLDLPASSGLFHPERVPLRQVVDSGTGGRPQSDADSPVVLLGDSFVNVFDDPKLGFGESKSDDQDRIGAGFAQHLAAALGMPVDVIAKNGKAATEVRQDLANRHREDIRQKKIVLWVIASRDLFYTPGPALENGVVWKDVTWRQSERPEFVLPKGSILVEATLDRSAPYPSPKKVNYPDSLYQTVWKDVKVIEGEALPAGMGEIVVEFWAFRKRRVVATGRLESGSRYRFAIRPKFDVSEIESSQVSGFDDENYFDVFFAESAEPVAGP